MAIQNDLDIKLEINNNKCGFTLQYVQALLNRVNAFLENNYSEENKYASYVNKLLSTVDIAFAAELLLKILCIQNGLSEEEFITHNLNELFNKLPSNIQREITNNMNISVNEFQNLISNPENNIAYEHCRYITNHFCNPNYNFLKDLTLSLYKIVSGKDHNQELKIRDIHITKDEYDTNIESLEKLYIKKLYEKTSYLKNTTSDNYNRYIEENILTNDYSLYIELSYKMYDPTGKSYGHENKDLYKKLDDELTSLFAKGIYSQFEYNRIRENYIYENGNLYRSMHFSLKSIFYPVDFENNYKKERNSLFKDIRDSFKKSRYCTFNYYYNYELLEKYCYVVKDLNDFLENEKELISKSIKFKKLFPDLVYQKWYMYDIAEIDYKKIEKLFEVKNILIEKNMGSYLYSYQYGYLIKNLLNYTDDQIDIVIERIRNCENNTTFIENMHRIDKDLIEEYCCTPIQNEVFKYLNAHPELSNKCAIKKADIEYIYKLISNNIINCHDRLIIKLIKNNYLCDIKKIEQLIQKISFFKEIDEEIKETIINNLGPFINLSEEKLHTSLVVFTTILLERKKFENQSCDFHWNDLSNLIVDDATFVQRCNLYNKIFGTQKQNYKLYFKTISNMQLKEVELLEASGYFEKFHITDEVKIYKYLCDKEFLQEYIKSNKFMEISLEEYETLKEPKKAELYTKFKSACMYDKRGKQGKKTIDEVFNKIWKYVEQDENHLSDIERIVDYQVIREHPEILKRCEFNEGTLYLLGDFNNLYYKIVNGELDNINLLSDDQRKKIEKYLLENTRFVDDFSNPIDGEIKQSGEHLRKIHQLLDEKKILPLISKSMWQYGDKDTVLNILQKISDIKFKNTQLVDNKKEFLSKYYRLKHEYEITHKNDSNNDCNTIDSLLDFRLNYINNIISKYNNCSNREDINILKTYLKDALICGMDNINDYIETTELIKNIEIYSTSNLIDQLDTIKMIGILSSVTGEKRLWFAEQTQREIDPSDPTISTQRKR